MGLKRDLRKGISAFLKGSYSKAESRLLKAIEQDPISEDGLYYLGRLQYKKHNFTEALDYFKQVNKTFPENVKAIEYIGKTYEKLNELCEWFKADPEYNGASDKIKSRVYHIAGLVKYAPSARTFIKEQKESSELASRRKKEKEKYERRRQKTAINPNPKQNKDFGGYNG